MGVLVSGRRVLVGEIAMFLGRRGVLLRLVMVAVLMMMRRLMMMVGGGMVVSGGGVVMLARRMLGGFCHGRTPAGKLTASSS
jgi:hypothetical protein